jgi:uncharacterized protein
MPKKSSKKGSKKGNKKQAPAAETRLIPHAAPNLTDLLELAKRGKRSDVHQYLSAGGSANVLVEINVQRWETGRGSEVLHSVEQVGLVPLLSGVAALRHSEAAASIKLLLEAGAVVDPISSNDVTLEHTALMVACSWPHNLQAVHALLQGGADPCHQANGDGITALHLAASAGLTDTCAALHEASSGRALELKGSGDGLSATALSAACAMEQYAVVKLLCELGADVNHASVTGNTPLMVAAQAQDTSILQFLLQQDGIEVNRRNRNGCTALMGAAAVGSVTAVKLLLQHGADACVTTNKGYSAVFDAVAGGHLHVLQLLVQHGAAVTTTTDRGYTLLMHAATSNQQRVAEHLINAGISVHAADALGATALHWAALSANSGTETMRVLLAHGADVNACDTKCCIPLHFAALRGLLDKAEALLAASADVLHCDVLGATALHMAIDTSQVTVVERLLEHGADAVLNTLQCKMWDNGCYVPALMMCNDTATLKLLLAAGADVHAVTCCGYTCLHIAAKYIYSAPVVCLLIEQLLIRAAQQA